jgi:hypothetical protein
VLTGVVTPVVGWVAIGYGVLARPNGRSAAPPMPRSAAVLADPEGNQSRQRVRCRTQAR